MIKGGSLFDLSSSSLLLLSGRHYSNFQRRLGLAQQTSDQTSQLIEVVGPRYIHRRQSRLHRLSYTITAKRRFTGTWSTWARYEYCGRENDFAR